MNYVDRDAKKLARLRQMYLRGVQWNGTSLPERVKRRHDLRVRINNLKGRDKLRKKSPVTLPKLGQADDASKGGGNGK